MFTQDQDTRAMAVVALGLSFAAISYLQKARLLSHEDLAVMFETPLAVLENLFPADDPSIAAARRLLDRMASIATGTADTMWSSMNGPV